MTTRPEAGRLVGGILVSVAVAILYASAIGWSQDGSSAAAIASSTPWPELVVGARALAWPGLLASRVGFGDTWVAVLLAAIGTGWWFLVLWRWTARSPRLVTSLSFLALPAVVYCGVALLYLRVLPVPQPAMVIPQAEAEVGTATEPYRVGYETGYRAGMINDWAVPDGTFPSGFGRGLWDGYSHGLGEWLRLSCWSCTAAPRLGERPKEESPANQGGPPKAPAPGR